MPWPKGKPRPPETRERIRKAVLGKNKGNKRPDLVVRNKTLQNRKRVSVALTGRIRSEEHCANIAKARLGTKWPIEARLAISQGQRSGKNNANWRGGVNPINEGLRRTTAYRLWRQRVFERDEFTCQRCSIRGVLLNADHVMPFAFYPDLRFELLNGRTLCVPCHKLTPTYLNHKNIYA